MTKDVWRKRKSVLVFLSLSAVLSGCAAGGAVRHESAPAKVSPQESLISGDESARRGDFEQALYYYLEAVAAQPTADAWFRVGAASTELGHHERALQAYLEVIKLEPDRVDAHEAAGLEYLKLNDPKAARPLLEAAVAKDSQRWRSLNALGLIADSDGDHAAAAERYSAALAINPRSPMVLNNRGYSRYLANDLDAAARDFYAAMQLDPSYTAARSNLAMVYAERGGYAEAIDLLAGASDKSVAYNDIGYIALQRGDLQQAENLLSEAVRLSPVYYRLAHENLDAVRTRLRDDGEAKAE